MTRLKERFFSAFLVLVLGIEGMLLPVYAMEPEQSIETIEQQREEELIAQKVMEGGENEEVWEVSGNGTDADSSSMMENTEKENLPPMEEKENAKTEYGSIQEMTSADDAVTGNYEEDGGSTEEKDAGFEDEKEAVGNEDEEILKEEIESDKEEADKNYSGETVSQNTTEDEILFSLNPLSIMYGESDENKNGTLDLLFQPSYKVNEEEYIPESENGKEEYQASEPAFSTSYKFVTKQEKLKDLTVRSFDALESEELSSIPAGTVVYVASKATAENQPEVIATDSFIMEKRKVRLHFEVPPTEAINEKSEIEDDKLVVDRKKAKEYLTVEVVENQFNEEGISTFTLSDNNILSEEILTGDVILDVSEIDYEEIGYQEVPMTIDLMLEEPENYEILSDTTGYVYVEETIYYITFTVKNNGKTKELKYILDQTYLSEGRTITEMLNYLGKYQEVYPTMGGFLENEEGVSLVGWVIRNDEGRWETELLSDFSLMYEEDEYTLAKKTDYYLTASLYKKTAQNIYVEVSPSVVYDGRVHVVNEAGYSATKNNDLNLDVIYVGGDEGVSVGTYLRYGKDYKVTYKNNKEVSVKTNERGEYEPLYKEGVNDNKRPCAIVTGIGNYKGFSATVYFDILPLNIGSGIVEITGLKNSYVLNAKGKIQGGITPKVKLKHSVYNGKKWVNKTVALKLGKDYLQKLYIYEDNRWKECADSKPSNITKESRYLYTIRGIGRYCGTAFGQTYQEIFSDGTEGGMNPEVCSYVGTDIRKCQFIVIGDASQDLSKAKISVKKSQLKYKRNTYYTGADFGITVTIGKGADKRVLTEGVDYYITFDGTDFEYVRRKNNDGVFNMGLSSEIYQGSEYENASITIANKYDVTITAIEGNDNGIFGSKKAKSVRIKGIELKPSWFKIPTPTLKYTGNDSRGFNTRYSRKMKVSLEKPNTLLRFDSNGYSDYLEKKDTLLYNAVFAFSDGYNKNPGTYERTIIPVGPGVDHDKVVKVKFKRTGITTKEAFKKGILRITYDAADYNAGGALPKNIKITLNGVENKCGDMRYNGQSFYVNDRENGMNGQSTGVNLKLTVSNNKKTGTGAVLYVQGDGTVFKGKSGKFSYSVNPITVSDVEIPVLNGDTYVKDYGKSTQKVYGDGFYAKYEPVIKTASKTPKYKITLYQSYYKNEEDYYAGRRSLAKLSNKQYKLILTEDGSNGYYVDVGNSKAKIITGYDFQEVSIAENYTVFDKSATISRAIVRFNGKEYEYPTDTKEAIPFTGDQIRFDKKQGDGVIKVVLKDGTELDSDDFYVEYGDNVAVGKGSFTVILKRNSEGDYKYGGKATFRFTIGNVEGIVL